MDPIRFRRLMDALGDAMQLAPEERGALLDRRFADDSDLLDEARALCAEAEATSFERLTERLESAVDPTTDSTRIGERALPEWIGPYRILGVLGEGGMGLVYHAEQIEPIHREVALKMAFGGLRGDAARIRFEAERQALAVMSHPGIARIFDAGATEDGVPYFVMELVPGDAITEYCDAHRLSLAKRLRLFEDVCHAVQHAHLKGVIHRDLKPSNVLVGDVDGQPRARVIDFGIAKAAEAAASGGATRTMFGAVMGTLEYMSPEQATGGLERVDTRSDIYSLGVILYELATGSLPFDSSMLRNVGLVEIQHLIRETPPPSPARRYDTSEAREAIARARSMDTRALTRRLSGDLGWIIMRALEKEPARRYQSAGDLAADLDRLARHQPVEAGPPSRSYRARRFVRRHRVGVAAAITVIVTLVGGVAVATAGLVRATRAQLRAEAEAERATLIKDFLTGMLAGARPENAAGRDVRVMDLVDSTAARLERDQLFADEPLVLADVVHAVGETYRALDDAARAIPLFRRAVDLKRSAPGDNRESILISLNKLSESEAQLGDLMAATVTQTEVVELAADLLGTENPRYAAWLGNLANMHADMGDLVSAEAMMRDALQIDRRVRSPDDDQMPTRINNLATILVDLERCQEALPLHEESIALRRRLLGEPSAEVAIALGNYASALSCAGRYGEAEAAATAALRMATDVFGADHQRTATIRLRLGEVLMSTGRAPEAEPLLRQSVAVFAAIDPLYFRTGGARAQLGEVLLMLGREEEGVEELEAGYSILAGTVRADVPRMRRFAGLIADHFEGAGDASQAAHWRVLAGDRPDRP